MDVHAESQYEQRDNDDATAKLRQCAEKPCEERAEPERERELQNVHDQGCNQ
jgi:hypothetical protein